MLKKLFLAVAFVAVVAVPARAVEVQRVVSPGGIEAWLIEDSTVPLVSVSFAFAHAGAAADPEGKSGLANLLSGMLDEGAGDIDRAAFQRELSDKSIRMSFAAGRDDFSGFLKFVTKHQDRAFEMLGLALTQPRFDDEPVARLRQQIITGLRHDENDPRQMVGRSFFEAAFPGHPYARNTEGTEEEVSALSAADLRELVTRGFAKDNLIVGVSGDVTAETLGRLLDTAFAALPDAHSLDPVPVAEIAPGSLQIIEKPVPQSTVMFGQAGVDRNDPDFWPAYVANYILGGGGFNSRLTEEVREKRGLAYSVYSYLVDYKGADLMIGGVATDNARVSDSLDLIRAEWQRMAEAGVTEEELANAKAYLTGAFPLRFTSTDGIARMLMGMQLDELGIDYLDRRNGYIEAVTVEDIARVAADLWRVEDLVTVVAGQPAGLDG